MLRKLEECNKEEVFLSLSPLDLLSLLQNLSDSSLSLRKVSALFLVSLLHQSKHNITRFCHTQHILPMTGKVLPLSNSRSVSTKSPPT